jgi:(1->4)-alpha-D-glucan 1-alpha-D-glucosylmutase
VRLQQLCGAATAKSMEDCLFYRDARLVSLNEVGGEPDRSASVSPSFHQRAATGPAVAARDDGVDHPRHQAR